MELTLFIKRSNSENANSTNTISSFKNPEVILKDIIYIDNLLDIDYGRIKTDWWLVLYDDEVIEDRLLEVFPFIRDQLFFDCFSLYRRNLEGKITYCPRLFRKEVHTRIDYLYPKEEVKLESLLDGWICEQGYPL
jgi:hypothetical protein